MDFPDDIKPEPAAAQLRMKTRTRHDAVDALYSRFDLAARPFYGAFLEAQYRAVAAIENALAAFPLLPAWRPRAGLIAADLRRLGLALPAPLRIDLASCVAQAHGVLYVVEGSRLGGRLLVRNIAPDLPISFLSDGHQPGEWKRLLADLDDFADNHPNALLAMVAGAEAGFDLFAKAAAVNATAKAPQ